MMREATSNPQPGKVNNRRQGQQRRPTEARKIYESNGYLGRFRGTAEKIYDKYLAASNEDRGKADKVRQQTLLQQAEHYFRLAQQNKTVQKPGGNETGRQNRHFRGRGKPFPRQQVKERPSEAKPSAKPEAVVTNQ